MRIKKNKNLKTVSDGENRKRSKQKTLDREIRYLGGDASDVEARAAEGSSLLDAGGLEAQLCGLDGRHVASGPAADDDHVVLFGSGGEGSGSG